MFGGNNESHITGDNNFVFQDVTGSTITVNLNNPEELRTFLINFQDQLQRLPIEILDQLKQHQNLETPPVVGANLYFTVLAAISETFTGAVRGQALFNLNITNLTKEIRYFNQPYFQTEPKLPLPGAGSANSFIMFNRENAQFPVRLEYGQVFSLTYEIKPIVIDYYRQISSEGAYIQGFVTTTVGELHSSNKYDIPKFLEQHNTITRTS